MYNNRAKCKDVFNAFLTDRAGFSGKYEIPEIKTSEKLPTELLPFSKANRSKTFDRWICFYEHDERYNRLWNDPKRYLGMLKRFGGVISPDFSVYRDMPLAMQIFNIYKGRAIGAWLNANGIDVIPNVRWGDGRTFETACAGVEKHKTIAVGTHGCIRAKDDRLWFEEGLKYIVDRLEPTAIVVYGQAPEKLFAYAAERGIKIVPFESEILKVHIKENC